MRSFKSNGLAGKKETQPTRYTLALFNALMEFEMSRLENNTEGGKKATYGHAIDESFHPYTLALMRQKKIGVPSELRGELKGVG